MMRGGGCWDLVAFGRRKKIEMKLRLRLRLRYRFVILSLDKVFASDVVLPGHLGRIVVEIVRSATSWVHIAVFLLTRIRTNRP